MTNKRSTVHAIFTRIAGRTLAGMSLGLMASGCANLNSVFRTNNTDTGTMQTLLIDAKQRPISINTVSDPRKPKFCLARSADALSQAAASGNLQVTQASQAGGALGFATAEQVLSIGYRDVVTEGEQEFLYQLCQMNSNGAISDQEVADNLRHFQNVMLAMVAIDKIGSAPAAASDPKAGDGGNAGSTDKNGGDNDAKPDAPSTPTAADAKTAALTTAQSTASTKQKLVTPSGKTASTDLQALSKVTVAKDAKAAATKATTSLGTADKNEKAYAQSLDSLQKAVAALAGVSASVPDDVTTSKTNVAAAAKDTTTNSTALKTAVKAVGDATDDSSLKTAQDGLTAAYQAYNKSDNAYTDAMSSQQKALDAWAKSASDANQRAKTSAAKPAGDSGSKPAAASNPQAVTDIVQTIVFQSFVTERCMQLLFDAQGQGKDDVRQYCLDHLKKVDEARLKLMVDGHLPVGSNWAPMSTKTAPGEMQPPAK